MNLVKSLKKMQEIELTDIRKLTQLVKRKYEYDFSNYAISSFKRRVSRVVEQHHFHTIDKLIERLEKDSSFFDTFISEITVNVTEMFRDPSFWRILRDQIIPNILLNHENISIWHAGCSSGEEVHSMAILLKEMSLLEKARIVATDVDRGMINRAKRGICSAKSMELNEKNYIRFQGKEALSDYYSIEGSYAHLNQDLIKNVSFREHDLVLGPVFSKFDIVLCRNVMIYFNQNLQNEVLKKLHESLFKYSYLAIGSKESLIWCDIANKFIVANNEEKIYKKLKD